MISRSLFRNLALQKLSRWSFTTTQLGEDTSDVGYRLGMIRV
jgi:hypothetical protein